MAACVNCIKKKDIFYLLLLFYLFALRSDSYGQGDEYRFMAGKYPDRINLTITENTAVSMAVTWRTDTSVKRGIAEIAPANADPRFSAKAGILPATTEWSVIPEGEYKNLKWPEVQANYHSVQFKNLQPNTLYNYRVGSKEAFSEWFQFRTASENPAKFSFLYFGDAQTGIHSLWSQVIRRAWAHAPHSLLMLHAGDLINRAGRDLEWGEWFEAGSFIHAYIPNMPSPGNHEYKGTQLSPHWRSQFTLPENGPQGLEETSYFADVQGVRFISLNSHMAEESAIHRKNQKVWLESLLKNNPQKWTVVVFHHPVFSAKDSRDNENVRKSFKPLFDKYQVDLVLQGHDHTYARGMEKIPMENKEHTSGTMYVISVSGPKMTGSKVETKEWMDKDTTFTQLYQVITIDDNKLSFGSYTSTGELFDAFDLIKQSGEKNKIINKLAKPFSHLNYHNDD